MLYKVTTLQKAQLEAKQRLTGGPAWVSEACPQGSKMKMDLGDKREAELQAGRQRFLSKPMLLHMQIVHAAM